ncbi:uncharacterized protein AKAW2_40567A [Aspergillus luchuensis]|uniref:Uncharacterized protein n=2 Tax=Aspergillus kawachii TaxID=1069201 RepID=A0A1M3T649_ASPLC|nr:uncharacterized protein AKAW2_40567A [Aspergillus luchuensis]OJZ82228.1 hypothetical protein ASPFODRAFT_143874 [Aspergillus luchuensis CBS 106.47]GAA88259.1 similar to An09g05550 [Aspergillus luchuensis IFO 4308]BCR98884.1 hypothetical protein AKAW2_40567A [Aspergillus luchuensis]BCS11198.1 hypothetical protein ALUC_40538A [Aspergillus luchuensis]GAT27777.1 similar to An09g05550 [Aspergillus luchuensis]
MVNPLHNGVATGLLASFLIQQGLALELTAFNPSTTTNTQVKVAAAGAEVQTQDYSSIDLRTSHSFYWGASTSGGSTLGNLTLVDESILPMESFSDMLENIQCTNSSITLGFSDSDAFTYAKNSWTWVNKAANNTFLMVAGVQQCNWNTQRVPFVITAANFQDNSTVRLAGKSATWDDVLRNHEITIGKAPSDMAVELTKRGITEGTKSGSISIDKTASDKSVKILSKDDLTLSAECKSCGTSGEFDVEFKYKVKPKGDNLWDEIGSFVTVQWEVSTAELTITPKDVELDITPALELSGNLTKSYSDEATIASLPLEGIKIPDVFTLDVQLAFDIGASAGPVNGDASISYPMKISLDNDAEAVLDIANEKVTHKNWTPTIKTDGVKLDAEIDATLEAYVKASLELVLSLGKKWGYEAGIYLKPFLAVDFTAEASTSGTCSDTSKNYHYAIEVEPYAGIELGAEVAKVSDEGNPIADATLASFTQSMSSTCIGFDSITSTKTATSTKTKSTDESSSDDETSTKSKSKSKSKSSTKSSSKSASKSASKTKSHPNSASASATPTGHSSTHKHTSSSTKSSETSKSTITSYPKTTSAKATSSHAAASSSAHSVHNHGRSFRQHGRI